MRAPRTLTAYVVREVALYTVLGLAAITVVLVTRNLVRALDELLGVGFAMDDLLLVLRLLGTMLVVYALPVAFLFGVLLALGRMAADVEITAMRACGVGLRALAVPILVLGLLLSAATLQLTLEAEPKARRDLRTALASMIARGAAIEPGAFRQMGDRLLYVQARDDAGGLRGIVISDRTNPDYPFMVFAESGNMRLDDENSALHLRLEEGDIHLEPEGQADDRYQRISFAQFDYAIDLTSVLGPTRQRRAKEMSMAELAETIEKVEAGETAGLREEQPVAYALHWHRRTALPFAPALFGLVGVPLAIRRTRGARSMGTMWCAGLAFAYYILQSFCEFLAVQGWILPAAAPWIPNAIFAALGAFLLQRARRAGM